MTLEADTELLLASSAFTGARAELWFGRFGVRLNGGLASPSLADDPATGFGLLTGDVDVTYRLRWPEPGLFFQPYAAGGLGVVRYDLDPDATTVAGEAYEADPATRTSLMLGVGADFGRGPLAVRLELMDIIGVASPLSQADGTGYGPVQHVVLTVGLSWRAGRIALPPRPEPTARPRPPPTRVPSPTRFPPQGPRGEEPEEPDTTTAPPRAEPEEPDTTGPQIRPPDQPGEKPEPVVTPVEPPPDTTARDTTPPMTPPPPTPTPTPREPPALPPEPTDTAEVPARPELPRVRRPLPPPPDSAPEDSVRIGPPDEPGEGPPVAPPEEPPTDTTTPAPTPPPTDTTSPPPDSTVTPPPSDTTSPPPDSTVTPPPSDTTSPPPDSTVTPPPSDTPPPDSAVTPPPTDTTSPPPDTAAPPPDTGAVHGRLFAVQASWPTDDEAAAERAAALADSVRARGLPVVRSEGRVRGRRVTLLRIGALRNAADANTLGAFVQAVYELDREWVHIPKDEEVPAADVAASEAFVEELREQYGQGTPK